MRICKFLWKILSLIKMSKTKKAVYDHTHTSYLSQLGQRIFMIIVVIYLLVDLTERLLNIRFEAWIFAVLYAGTVLGLFIMAVSFLEKKIMSKLND